MYKILHITIVHVNLLISDAFPDFSRMPGSPYEPSFVVKIFCDFLPDFGIFCVTYIQMLFNNFY